MHNRAQHHELKIAATDVRSGWARYDAVEIFRELVLGEIRSGRVSRAQYNRMLSFAAEIGLSNAEAVELILDCGKEVLTTGDSMTKRHAQRLLSPGRNRMLRAVIIIALIVAAELALIYLI